MNVALVLVLPPADGRYLLPAFPMAILLAMWSVSDWASRFMFRRLLCEQPPPLLSA